MDQLEFTTTLVVDLPHCGAPPINNKFDMSTIDPTCIETYIETINQLI